MGVRCWSWGICHLYTLVAVLVLSLTPASILSHSLMLSVVSGREPEGGSVFKGYR